MNEVISSLQNERVKMAYSLQQRPRARRKEKKIVLEGTRLIGDALSRDGKPEFVLYSLQDADYDLIAKLQNTSAKLLPVSDEVLQYVSDTQQPQGMVAVFAMPIPPMPHKPKTVLMLDSVREPGNMGTILRTAGASGVDVVVLSPECVDPYNPKVLRSGMGAHFRVPILELQWFEIVQYLQSMNIYVAAGEAETSYTDIDFSQPSVIVIGNEAHGVREAAKLPNATGVSIPMASGTESLNAAMASAVILFEAQRQRLLTSIDKK